MTATNTQTLLLLPGDGIGPEVTEEARRVAVHVGRCCGAWPVSSWDRDVGQTLAGLQGDAIAIGAAQG